MELSRRSLLVHVAVVGAMVGLLGAVGWRYATRRRVVLDAAPPVKPGDTGFVFTFDYLQYLAGPRWWPGLVALPAVGVLVAVALAMICWTALRSHRIWDTWFLVTAPAALSGACVAAAAVWLTDADRPAVLVRIGRGGSPTPAAGDDLIAGAPWNHELAPISVWFPVIGILGAVVLSTALHAGHRAFYRHRF